MLFIWRWRNPFQASDRRYPPGLGFVIDSPNHYILLSERLALKWINTVDLKISSITVSQHFCIWRRISKEDAGAFLADWIDDFLPKIPFDGSDLYEYYKEHGGDYGLLKKYLEGIFLNIEQQKYVRFNKLLSPVMFSTDYKRSRQSVSRVNELGTHNRMK